MPRPHKFGECVLDAHHTGDCVGGLKGPTNPPFTRPNTLTTPWVMKSYSSFDNDPLRPRTPGASIAKVNGRVGHAVRSNLHPELAGLSFKTQDNCAPLEDARRGTIIASPTLSELVPAALMADRVRVSAGAQMVLPPPRSARTRHGAGSARTRTRTG